MTNELAARVLFRADKLFYTPKECAPLARMSKSGIYEAIAAGELKAVRLRGRSKLLVRGCDLEVFLNDAEEVVPAAKPAPAPVEPTPAPKKRAAKGGV